MTATTGKTGYVLAAGGREAHEIARLELLQQIFDPITERRLDLVEPGWRCLEVGAGRGSIAQLLSERVGPHGEVIAADIDVGPLAHLDLPNGRVARFNILTDPLDAIGGAGSFDLIHCRFLLQHLSERQDEGIARMVELLMPGGWLVTEDTDTDNMAAADPAHPLTEAYNQAMAGGVTMLHQTKAIDPVCGRGMLPRFNRAGLLELRHEGITMLDQGGGPLCTWYAMSTEGSTSSYEGRNRDQPVSLTLKALNNPDFWLMSGVYHCAWGRKAG